MNDTLFQAVIWAVVIIVAYAVLARGLFRATEPVRYRLLDLGTELLSRRDLPEQDKAFVVFALHNVYSVREAWRIAARAIQLIFVFPFISGDECEESRLPDEFRIRSLTAVLGNSPAAALITIISIILVMAFSTSANVIGKFLSRGTRPSHHHHAAKA